MFSYQDAQVLERKRPRSTYDIAEFARLEYPGEDPRTVGLRVLQAVEETKSRRKPFHLFRRTEPVAPSSPQNV
jgi:hypothetical protein